MRIDFESIFGFENTANSCFIYKQFLRQAKKQTLISAFPKRIMQMQKIDIANTPTGPGIYIFRDKDNKVLYVGKAKSIKNRIKTYFQNIQTHSAKVKMMLKNAHTVEYMLTDTELEALILESNLIKKHYPKYNILLKDDKSYPFICASLNEEFPRIYFTRKRNDKHSKYFGPYPETHEIKKTIRYLNNLFGIRTCRDKKFARVRPCLNYDIGRCSAPCTGKVTKTEYQKNVGDLILFLAGKNTELLKQMESKMQSHSKKREYEAAKQYRDRIEGIKKISSTQKIISQKNEDIDIIASHAKNQTTIIQLLFIRSGSLISKTDYIYQNESAKEQEILNSFMKQYYTKHEIPKTILISHEIEDKNIIQKWLTEQLKHPEQEGKFENPKLLERSNRQAIRIIVPKKGEKHKLILLAQKNAKMNLNEHNFRCKKNSKIMESLKDQLNLKTIPRRIEAFDISNISGRHACASMIVFIDAEPKKQQYRRYKIKTVQGIDDYAMMQEVIERRYTKHTLPDLILIDGGKGQLNAVLTTLKKLNILHPQIMGLAKEHEEIYLPHRVNPVILPKDSEALYLLQRVRDEAHRFAIAYHKLLRAKSLIE